MAARVTEDDVARDARSVNARSNADTAGVVGSAKASLPEPCRAADRWLDTTETGRACWNPADEGGTPSAATDKWCDPGELHDRAAHR